MSALEDREKFQVICYGKITNYWSTDDEEEARLVFDLMIQFLKKKYYKISISEWKYGKYEVINQICALSKVSRSKKF